MSMTLSPLADHQGLTIADVMSKPVLTVEIDESLWDAWQLLFVSGLRHLVVIDKDSTCLGVLSDRNILADVPATMDHLGQRFVREILARVPAVTIHPESEPVEAARLMREHAIEAVPVTDTRGHVVGIITESDVVRWVVG
jgi:CBS domain-containing protein